MRQNAPDNLENLRLSGAFALFSYFRDFNGEQV
jgi:hypothetical protein